MKIARGKNASLNIAGIEEDTELFSLNRHKKQFKQAGFVDIEEDQMDEPENKRNRIMRQANQEEIEQNIEYLYQEKKQKDNDYKERKKQEKIEKETKSKYN